MRSEKWDEAVLVDTLKQDWMDAAWLHDDRLIQRSDYNVSGLGTSGYVTAGKSRVVSEYRNSVGTHHCHLQSTIDEAIHMETCISLYRQYKCSDNVLSLQFGTPHCILKCTYSLQLKYNFSERHTKHVRHVNVCNEADHATL